MRFTLPAMMTIALTRFATCDPAQVQEVNAPGRVEEANSPRIAQNIHVANQVERMNQVMDIHAKDAALAPNPNPLYLDVQAMQPGRPEKHINVSKLQEPRREKDSDDLWKLQMHYQKVPVDQFAIHKVAELPHYINVYPQSVTPPETHKGFRKFEEKKESSSKKEIKEAKGSKKRGKKEANVVLGKKETGENHHTNTVKREVNRYKPNTHWRNPHNQHQFRPRHDGYYGRNSMGNPVIPLVVTDDAYRQFPGVTFITTLLTQTLTLITPTSVTQSVTSTGFTTIPTTFNMTLSSVSSSVTSDSVTSSKDLFIGLFVLVLVATL